MSMFVTVKEKTTPLALSKIDQIEIILGSCLPKRFLKLRGLIGIVLESDGHRSFFLSHRLSEASRRLLSLLRRTRKFTP